MKILITGATGFVGSKVLKELRKKYGDENIIALTSGNKTNLEWRNVKVLDSMNYDFNSDYLKINSCEGIQALMHIGAWIPKTTAVANDINLATSNITNTYNLLKL
jgi:nucleoside-diphosphate-sugar epimerase